MTVQEILDLPIADNVAVHPAVVKRFRESQRGWCEFAPEVAFDNGDAYIAADGARVRLA